MTSARSPRTLLRRFACLSHLIALEVRSLVRLAVTDHPPSLTVLNVSWMAPITSAGLSLFKERSYSTIAWLASRRFCVSSSSFWPSRSVAALRDVLLLLLRGPSLSLMLSFGGALLLRLVGRANFPAMGPGLALLETGCLSTSGLGFYHIVSMYQQSRQWDIYWQQALLPAKWPLSPAEMWSMKMGPELAGPPLKSSLQVP